MIISIHHRLAPPGLKVSAEHPVATESELLNNQYTRPFSICSRFVRAILWLQVAFVGHAKRGEWFDGI